MTFDLKKIDIESLVPETSDAPLRSTMAEAVKVNPDTEVKFNELSKASGMPVEVVKTDPESVESSLNFDKIDFDAMSKRNPNTAKYLTDFNNASIAHDDHGTLGELEDVLSIIPGSIADAFRMISGVGAAERLLRDPGSIGMMAAGVTQGTLGISESIWRTPGALDRYLGAAAESIEGVTGLPRKFDPIRGLQDIAGFVSEGRIPGFDYRTGGTNEIAGMVSDASRLLATQPGVFPESFARLAEKGHEADNALQDAIKGDFTAIGETLRDVEAWAGFLGQAAPSLVMAYASGGSLPFIAWMEGMEAANSATEFEETTGQKITDAQFVQATAQSALINMWFEKAGLKEVFGAKGGGIADILIAIASEGGTEGIQAWNSNLSAIFAYDPTASQIEGILGSIMGGMGAGGTVSSVDVAISSVNSRNQQTNTQQGVEQTAIDKINDSSNKSKLKNRDKELFREFIKDTADNADVFIDGVQTQLYLQTKTPDEIKADPGLQLLQKKADEAAALGADLAIPVSDFATDVVGTESYDALREHMKLSPETSTPFRQEQVKQENENYIQTMINAAEEDISTYVESQEIFISVRDQLIDTGRMTPQQARVIADIVPAWATVQAQNRGIPVSQVYQESGLTIEGPLTGEAARLAGERVFEQEKRMFQAKEIDYDEEGQPLGDTFLFHGTGEGAFRKIREEGLIAKEDKKHIYFANTKEYAETYAIRKGAPFGTRVLRIKKTPDIIADTNVTEEGDFKTTKDILPNDIEINIDGKWIPIQEYSDERINILPIQKFEQQSVERVSLTSVGLSDTFSIEETKQRLEEGLYVHDTIPGRIREAAHGENIKAASAVAKGSLRASGSIETKEFSGIANPDSKRQAASSVREDESTALREFAEQNDLMLPEYESTLNELGNKGGNENYAYFDESTGRWMKANFFAHTPTFSELFDRVMIHNVEFPEAAYNLEGFTDIKGEFLPVFSQMNIAETGEMTPKQKENEASDRLTKSGFTGETDFPGMVSATNFTNEEGVLVHDIHSGNLIEVDGDVAIVDPVITMDPATKEQRIRDAIAEVEAVPAVFRQEAKGYYDPENSLIRLTESSDLSTFLHEFAHFMYDMELKNPESQMTEKIHNWFKRNAENVAKEANTYAGKEGPLEQPEIPKGIGDITAANVTAYLDTGTSGDIAKDSAIERAVHEQFVRGFETYLMEGKAPSMELRNVFRTFARWLTQIYQSIRGDLKVNLDEEMRDVFARMIATDEQIAAAEARARFEPMFTDAAMAGMTEEEFQKYQERQAKPTEKAIETLRDKMIKQLTRQTEKWWKEEKADIVEEEIERLSKERVYVAKETLLTGEFKLDRKTVKETFGEERTDKLGRTTTRIPESLRNMTAEGGEGVHPDEAAGFLGYNSGDEMIQDLINTPVIKRAAEENAEQEMLRRHGDIMNDGTIEKEADDAIQNEERGSLIIAELKALSKGTGRATIERQMLKTMAEENIGKLSFRDIHPGKYRKAEIRAAQEASAELAAGNKEAAATAKARQALNFYLGKAATEAKNDTIKIVDRMARYRKKSVREAIMKAEGGYWEQLTKILNRFEFRKGATLGQVDRLNVRITEWAKDKIENDGDGLVLSAEILDEGYVTHWKNVPYDALIGISDSVKNIEHVARYSNKITRREEEITFQKLVQQWTTSMNEKVKTRFPTVASVADKPLKAAQWGRWAMAQMTKIPYLASWLDGGERAGLSHDILVQPFTNAYNEELRLWDEVGSVVMEAIQNRDKETIARHNRKVYIPAIKGTAKHTGNLMGHEILAVALNTGNESNLKKMLLGEEWANPDIEAEITIENPKLQAVLGHMTKSDWELVQLIWDQMDLLYPKLAEVHRRTTGLTPPKIEATPVETDFGTFKGGYYPVKYDPNRSAKAQQNEDRLNAETESMFGKVGIQASVNASATSERSGFYDPIRLSLDIIPNHFQETIHYITHHDAVRETNKLIKNESVATMIKEKLGPEEYAQLKPWLNDIAKDGREAPLKMFWGSMLQRLRFGTTLGVMGFKASTGIIQILGMSNTIAEVGSGPVYQSLRSILGSTTTMQKAWNFAVDNSKVLSHRTKTMDREIKNAMQKLEGKRGIFAAVQEASMKHIALIQTYMVDLPSWHAAYIKGMKEWGDEKRSHAYADWVIENIQGSGVTKDMAQIMRGQSQESRMFTMFMTFFSSLWNQERDIVKGAKAGKYSRTTVAAKMMFLFAVPVFLEMVLRGDFGDDDDEDSNLQKYLTQLALYPAQSVPFLRDVASATVGEYGYNISPIAQIVEAGTKNIPELVTRPFTDEEITKGQVKGATKFIGAAVGIPGVNQAWGTGEHLYDVMVEGEEFTVNQLLYGPRRK